MPSTVLTLPWPPSVNRYWRHWRGRMVISTEGRAYREQVLAGAKAAKGWRAFGAARLEVHIDCYPPDRRARDIDNLAKAGLDAMQAAGIYDSDSQIDLLQLRRYEVIAGGQLIVSVSILEESR